MDVKVGAVNDFKDPGRKILDIGGMEIAVFKLGGSFYAYENHCPHLGGPGCQGKMLPLTLEALDDDKTSRGREFCKERMNVVCPWHGMEFDIRTGEHPIQTAKYKLRKVPVRVEQEEVVVTLPRVGI
jgi:nitrite reductase/ring-hydroxylating ferredoxin subunit